MRRRRRWHSSRSFVMIPRGMLFNCKEWKELSAPAKLLYIMIKARYNGSNNGDISLPYSALKDYRGISSSATISKASSELQKAKFIERRQIGGLFRRQNYYKLTGRFDDHL